MQKCSDTGERVRSFVTNYKLCVNYQSWYLFLRTAHSYSCSCHSNCSQHYAVGPATVALLPTCWHLVPSQLQTPYQCSHFLLISAGFVKTLLHLSCLLLKVIDPPNYVAMSVSLRGVRVSMFCTWQHWISIAPLSTLCRLTVHSRSAHGTGKYLDTETHSSLLDLPKKGSLDWSLPFKTERYFLDWHINLFVG